MSILNNGYVGIGTTGPTSLLSVVSSGNGSNALIRSYHPSYPSGYSYLGHYSGEGEIGAYDSDGVRRILLSSGQNSYINYGYVGIGTATPSTTLEVAGIIKTTDTTASTSSVTGALQVAGGIGVGGASYFGSSVTVAGNISGAGTNTWALQSVPASGALVAGGWLYGINNGFNITPNGAGVPGATFMLAAFDGTGYREMLSTANVASGVSTLRLAGYGGPTTVGGTLDVLGAATFSGAVTIAGNVGFYNNTPVAKPTGVAVTAAAIHAALVTLNLISA